MISPKNLTSPSLTSVERPELRAYCDFNLYKNDKVLATLVSREVKLPAAGGPTLPGGGQPEVGPQMRRIVANWMLEVKNLNIFFMKLLYIFFYEIQLFLEKYL